MTIPIKVLTSACESKTDDPTGDISFGPSLSNCLYVLTNLFVFAIAEAEGLEPSHLLRLLFSRQARYQLRFTPPVRSQNRNDVCGGSRTRTHKGFHPTVFRTVAIAVLPFLQLIRNAPSNFRLNLQRIPDHQESFLPLR